MTALLGLDLSGRLCLVAGGGTVAARRVRRLLAHDARVRVVAPQAGEDIARLAQHGDLEWRQRAVQARDLDEAWLVVAATDDDAVNDAVAQWAEQRRLWCVHASAASRGSARVAASSVHGDLALGVLSTGEPDPRRVRSVRDALAASLDRGEVDLRRRRPGPGRVILVGSGPGDPGLLTVRGRQALAEADVVVTDRLGATAELTHLPYDVEVVNVGKSPDRHPVPQDEIERLLVDYASQGKCVVRYKGGDPFVFGRGGDELRACVAAEIPVEVVPGVTSAFGVPARAGIPATQRGIAGTVVVTSGHEGADAVARAAMRDGATLIVLMGVAHLGAIAAAGLDAGAAADTPVAIIESGTTDAERVTRGPLDGIESIATDAGVTAPAIIVIGHVARPDLLTAEVLGSPAGEAEHVQEDDGDGGL